MWQKLLGKTYLIHSDGQLGIDRHLAKPHKLHRSGQKRFDFPDALTIGGFLGGQKTIVSHVSLRDNKLAQLGKFTLDSEIPELRVNAIGVFQLDSLNGIDLDRKSLSQEAAEVSDWKLAIELERAQPEGHQRRFVIDLSTGAKETEDVFNLVDDPDNVLAALFGLAAISHVAGLKVESVASEGELEDPVANLARQLQKQGTAVLLDARGFHC